VITGQGTYLGQMQIGTYSGLTLRFVNECLQRSEVSASLKNNDISSTVSVFLSTDTMQMQKPGRKCLLRRRIFSFIPNALSTSHLGLGLVENMGPRSKFVHRPYCCSIL